MQDLKHIKADIETALAFNRSAAEYLEGLLKEIDTLLPADVSK